VIAFNKNFLEKTLSSAKILSDVFPEEINFSVDTRKLQEGDIFIALAGKQTDGHNFVAQAIEQGAAGVFINKEKVDCISKIDKKILNTKLIVLVDDTLKALWILASAWREQFSYPVIGITGSVGKTSTKEMLANILKLYGMKVCVSYGNQNSLIGVPLNILKMQSAHQVAVIEMGINKRGEMATLAGIVKPTIGVITCIGHSHMEGLGSLSSIAAEKRDIFKYFKDGNIGIVNGDQQPLSHISYSHPVVKFGSKIINQVQARKIKQEGSMLSFMLKIYNKKYTVSLNSNHLGMVFNSLASAAVCSILGIPDDIIINGLSKQVEVKGRFQIKPLKSGDGYLIDDCYNAGPESMKSGLLTFESIKTKAQKIAVLSDMLELGTESAFWHRQIGRFLRKVPSLNHLILVGESAKFIKKTAPLSLKIDIFASWQEAALFLEEKISGKDSLIFVKGSTAGYTTGLVNLVNKFTESDTINSEVNINRKKTLLRQGFVGQVGGESLP